MCGVSGEVSRSESLGSAGQAWISADLAPTPHPRTHTYPHLQGPPTPNDLGKHPQISRLRFVVHESGFKGRCRSSGSCSVDGGDRSGQRTVTGGCRHCTAIGGMCQQGATPIMYRRPGLLFKCGMKLRDYCKLTLHRGLLCGRQRRGQPAAERRSGSTTGGPTHDGVTRGAYRGTPGVMTEVSS
jgi:hypothetical protein